LRNARGLYYRRALLAIGEARGLIFIRVHPAKFFAVGVKDGDQPVMMLAAAVFIKGGLFVFRAALGWSLGHGAILLVFPMMPHYRKQRNVSQVPREILARCLPADNRGLSRLSPAAGWNLYFYGAHQKKKYVHERFGLPLSAARASNLL